MRKKKNRDRDHDATKREGGAGDISKGAKLGAGRGIRYMHADSIVSMMMCVMKREERE